MGFVTIKMASRLAAQLLENNECRVVINKCHPTEIFVTEPGIKNGCVHIPKEHFNVPVEDITKIEYTNRFGNTSFMEVNWD